MILKSVRFPLLIITLLFVAYFSLNAWVDSYLRKLIINQIEGHSNDNHQLAIRKLHVNFFTSSIHVEDCSLKKMDVDSTIFSSEQININGINLIDLFFREKIKIRLIETERSLINLTVDKNAYVDSAATDSTGFGLYGLINDRFNSLQVEEIKILNPGFNYYSNEDAILSSTNGYIHIVNLVADSSTSFIERRPFSADSLEVYLMDIGGTTSDSLYHWKVPKLHLSYVSGRIIAESFQLYPNYSRKEFSRIAGKQIDRFEMNAKKILIGNVDVKRLIEKSEIITEKIIVDSLHANIYRDKYIPAIKEGKKFLQELIKDIEFPVQIDELVIENSDIKYSELIPPSKVPGTINFSEVNGTFYNISNHKSDSNMVMLFNVSGKLNLRSRIKAQLEFPMNETYFRGKGSIKDVLMKDMNSMFGSASEAIITDGRIDSITFSLESDDRLATGTMLMVYHDLRVAARNAQNDTSKLMLRVKSFIANNLVIKKSNPLNGKLRYVELNHKYANDKFLINNLWKTLMGGIQRTIGVKPVD